LTLKYERLRPYYWEMKPSVAQQPTPAASVESFSEPETDIRRHARVSLAHRKAIHDLAWVTLRYQVHNELAELRESETRVRARSRTK